MSTALDRLLLVFLAAQLVLTSPQQPLLQLRERRKRTNVALENEADVDSYLSSSGRSALIWRCKNQVLVQWHAKVVPYFEVECEVLGDVMTLEWLRYKKTIVPGNNSRYTATATPHIKRGHRFQRWLHYKLRVHWATEDDSGVYVLRVAGPRDSTSEERRIHARIVTEYNPKQMPSENDEAQTATGARLGSAASRKHRQRRLKAKTRRERESSGPLHQANESS